MSKQIVTMSNWVLRKGGEYNLCGTADNHPKLGRDVYVAYTSNLESYKLEDEILFYETKNTIYRCPLSYINAKNPIYSNNEEFLERIIKENSGDDILEKIMKTEAEISLHKLKDYKYNEETNSYDKLRDPEYSEFTKYIIELAIEGQKEIETNIQKEENRMIGIIEENNWDNCIYIEVTNINSGDKIAYKVKDADGKEAKGVVYSHIHSGMFQDSILYGEYNTLDFRYFPNFSGMSTYHWSDNIKTVYIKNLMNRTFDFNGTKVEPDELKSFEKTNHREGLLSPDQFDGSSMLIKKEED